MSDHDLLIRIDERVEALAVDVQKVNGVKPRIARLEATVSIIILAILAVVSLITTGTI